MRFAAFFAAFLASLPQAHADSLPDLKGQKVVVVIEDTYPPLQFVEPASGKATGWEYDAMNAIAKKLNMQVSYAHSSWDAMMPGIA